MAEILDPGFGFALQAQTTGTGDPSSQAAVDLIYGLLYWRASSPLAVQATASPTSGLAPLTVAFSCTPTGGLPPYTYSWIFGDLTSPTTSQNPSHTYTGVGSFNPMVIVTDAIGEIVYNSDLIVTVTGTNPLNVSTSAAPTSGDPPLVVQFNSSVTGGTPPYTYYWDFQDGNTSASANPTNTYIIPSVYYPTLRVVDSAANAITVNAPPIAVTPGTLQAYITMNASSGPAPFGVSFEGTAAYGTPPYSYSWNFGDGSPPVPGQNISHLFTSAGVYTVTLTVQDSGSQTATATASIVVLPAVAYSVAIAGNPTQGPPPLIVDFTSTVTGGISPYSYSWNFSDGTVAATSPSPTHTFAGVGNFPVVLTVTDSSPIPVAIQSAPLWITVTGTSTLWVQALGSPVWGNPPLLVTFWATATGGTGPYTYTWSFGTLGASGTGASASYTYLHDGTYYASVSVVDSVGNQATSDAVTITVGGSGSGSVSFTWIGADDDTPVEDIKYAYYLEPVESSWGSWVLDTSRTYGSLSSGDYTFHLKALDQTGLESAPVLWPFTVAGTGITATIFEDITLSQTYPATVTFTAAAMGGLPPYMYTWDFGDGSAPGSGNPVAHTYASSGTFPVSLLVTDAGSSMATASSTKYIGVSAGSISGSVQDLGYRYCSFFRNNTTDPTAGPNLWKNRPSASVPDGFAAYVTLSPGGGRSAYLVAKRAITGLPPETEFTGLELQLLREGPGVQDWIICAVKNGVVYSDHNRAISGDWPASYQWQTYGGSGDMWGLSSLTASDVDQGHFGFAIEVKATTGGTANVDSARAVFYYAGASYPVGIQSISVTADPYQIAPSVSATTDSGGNYTISPLLPTTYDVSCTDTTGTFPGWAFLPTSSSAFASGGVTGMNFEAYPTPFLFIRNDGTPVSSLVTSAPDPPDSPHTWVYFYCKSNGSYNKLKIVLSNITVTPSTASGGLDLYVRQGGVPDEDDPGTPAPQNGAALSDKIITIHPLPSGIQYWYIGIAVTADAGAVCSYTLTVTQS
jgi:PKD repeat protein